MSALSPPGIQTRSGQVFKNAAERALNRMNERPNEMALWTERNGSLTFSDLKRQTARMQALLRAKSFKAGDSVLLMVEPGLALFAAVLAVMGLGGTLVLVEPWLPVGQIEHVVKLAKPRFFLAGAFGKLWGLRVPAVRAIEKWISPRAYESFSAEGGFHLEAVSPDSAGIITFTSGTTGQSKGVVRSHRYLVDVFDVLEAYEMEDHAGPDLTIFANLVLYQMGRGRGSILVPHQWKQKSLAKVSALSEKLKPATLTAGPGFCRELLRSEGFSSLKSLVVGGALTDCVLAEKLMNRFRGASFTHIYGGTEAEPVALADLEDAVQKSRAAGFFQTLYVGHPILELAHRLEDGILWVSGPNVCGEYLGAQEENRLHKKRDASGKLWHSMGDRIRATDEGWWLEGRENQARSDFLLEQSVYSFLESSACFIDQAASGEKRLVGEGLASREKEIRSRFPSIDRVIETRIIRDRRHRARIDRARTRLKMKGSP